MYDPGVKETSWTIVKGVTLPSEMINCEGGSMGVITNGLLAGEYTSLADTVTGKTSPVGPVTVPVNDRATELVHDRVNESPPVGTFAPPGVGIV